jgi:hypothetical protein
VVGSGARRVEHPGGREESARGEEDRRQQSQGRQKGGACGSGVKGCTASAAGEACRQACRG